MKKTDNNQQTRPGNFAPLRYNSDLKKFDFEYQGLTYEIPEDEALRMAEFVVNSLKSPRTRPITDMTEEEGRELVKAFGDMLGSFSKFEKRKDGGVLIYFEGYNNLPYRLFIGDLGMNCRCGDDRINLNYPVPFGVTDFLRERGFEV